MHLHKTYHFILIRGHLLTSPKPGPCRQPQEGTPARALFKGQHHTPHHLWRWEVSANFPTTQNCLCFGLSKPRKCVSQGPR